MPRIDLNPRPPDDDSVFRGKNWLSWEIVKLISRNTPKCTEVVRLLSQGMDHPLPWSMRLRLRIHHLMCCYCERYEKQLHYLRRTLRHIPKGEVDVSQETLPSETKQRMKQALRAASHSS